MRRPIEVIIVATIVGLVGLATLMAIPRQREAARGVKCRDNLRLIGVGLILDSQSGGHLPAVPNLAELDHPRSPGPLATLLGDLGRADLAGLRPSKADVPPTPTAPPEGRKLAVFLCPSDPGIVSNRFPAPVSYRASAGGSPSGDDGVFAPGRILTTAQVEAADGLQFTAAFSERLLGNGLAGTPSPRNYAVASDLGSCGSAPASAWRGDAGRSWSEADWRSTLYNHSLRPNAKVSCIDLDGRSALMGASSGHSGIVHVLTLDGGVRSVGDRIDLNVWKALAAVGTSRPTPPTAPPKAAAPGVAPR